MYIYLEILQRQDPRDKINDQSHNSRRFALIRAKHRARRRQTHQIYAFEPYHVEGSLLELWIYERTLSLC